jgi:hypothetical protein
LTQGRAAFEDRPHGIGVVACSTIDQARRALLALQWPVVDPVTLGEIECERHRVADGAAIVITHPLNQGGERRVLKVYMWLWARE